MMPKYGFLETITGPMYAGKTSALLQKILWSEYQNKKVIVFKPKIDNRYSLEKIETHTKVNYPCVSIDSWEGISAQFLEDPTYQTVVLDEVQFMDHDETLAFVFNVLNRGIDVYCAGLDMDSRGAPFETTGSLMALSDHVSKIKSNCAQCGKIATKTQRLSNENQNRVVVGSSGLYEPRCNDHWVPM